MKTSCQKCGKQLKLSTKIEESVKKLEPGKFIHIRCPQCSGAIALDQSMAEVPVGRDEGGQKAARPAVAAHGFVQPPPPPDLTWLKDGVFDTEQVIEDVPLALLLMADLPGRETIISSIENIGYKTEIALNPEDAIEKMQFVDYSCVVLHSRFEGHGVKSSSFHRFICGLSMWKRRFIYYIVVGKEFKTLYNLQALAYSANLVVNENEIPYFNVIIRKAIPEYEELFGPIMEELRQHGK